MKWFFALLLALAALLVYSAFATAGELTAVPNPPAATGNQVWIVSNGKIIEKMTDTDFVNGKYARIGSVFVGETFCRPQSPPATPAPPAFPAPPPFVAPTQTADTGSPTLLEIIITVGAMVGGFIAGRGQADSDSEASEDAGTSETPAVVA